MRRCARRWNQLFNECRLISWVTIIDYLKDCAVCVSDLGCFNYLRHRHQIHHFWLFSKNFLFEVEAESYEVFFRNYALFTLYIQIDVVKEVAGMAGGEKLFWPSGYTSSVTDLWHGFNSHLCTFTVLYVLYTDYNQYTKRLQNVLYRFVYCLQSVYKTYKTVKKHRWELNPCHKSVTLEV